MGRAYLIIILMVGVFGSILTNGTTSSGQDGFKHASSRFQTDAGDDSESEADRAPEEGTIELERSYDGHFYADVEINGATIHALVDTGASGIALSREDARSAGVATSISMPDVVGRGASGEVYGEHVTLDRVVLGHQSAENMPAIVLNGGEETLLGQSFLSKFESVEIRGDWMVLR